MTRPVVLGSAVLAVVLDQVTKAAALWYLSPGAHVSLVPGLNLALGFNEGSSFGMLSGVMAGKPYLMVALTGLPTLIFAIMALRAQHPHERAGLALIVGGALGNIIDRLRQGAVTDFIDLYWRDWHWPTFNLADIAISLGAFFILAAPVASRRAQEPELGYN